MCQHHLRMTSKADECVGVGEVIDLFLSQRQIDRERFPFVYTLQACVLPRLKKGC